MASSRHQLLALIVVLVVSSAAIAQRPPTNLRQVGDHWTAWQPPTEFPEGAQLYLIQSGDTLWDLAGRFYGNPYLWPQIWEQNRYILDAHWIYPGDPLVVGMEVTPVEELSDLATGMEEAEAPEPTAESRFAGATGPPAALGGADDIYCTGYIGDADEQFDLRIVGSEYSGLEVGDPRNRTWGRQTATGTPLTAKLGLALGDIVYLDAGMDQDLMPGSLYTAVRPGRLVRHAYSDELLGRAYQYLGRVRLLSVQETTAIGEIVHSCHPIEVGSTLKPFERVPVPLARRTGMRGVNDPVSATELESAAIIALSDGDRVAIGQGHMVFIDRGSAHDVTPGDIYTIYRLNRGDLPPMVIGELAVLTVGDRTSLAKVVESRYLVQVGDRLDLK